MPALPTPSTDARRLADWIEIAAILSRDGSSSIGELERQLNRESVFDGQANRLQTTLAEVSSELSARSAATGTAYPFQLLGSEVRRKAAWAKSSYAFCLVLSYAGWDLEPDSKEFPARVFEQLCTEVGKVFVTGAGPAASVRFGAPRTGGAGHAPKPFKEAVTAVCVEYVKEGIGWRQGRKLGAHEKPQDNGLDVIAWRNWADGRSGKLILFGACATGKDWSLKLRELSPQMFFEEWATEIPSTPVIKGFFIPHRIPAELWRPTTREAGIVFDRCRISALVGKTPASVRVHGDPFSWMKKSLKSLRTPSPKLSKRPPKKTSKKSAAKK